MVYLGSAAFKKYYHAKVCTMTAFVAFLVWAMIIVFPFAIAFKTKGT